MNLFLGAPDMTAWIPNKSHWKQCKLAWFITVRNQVNLHWFQWGLLAGVWEFLFWADFLVFENFLLPKFQLFLLFSAYFCHFCPISRHFSSVFVCGLLHPWIRYSCSHISGPHEQFPPNLDGGGFSSCSTNLWYLKRWNAKKLFCDVITSVLYNTVIKLYIMLFIAVLTIAYLWCTVFTPTKQENMWNFGWK